MTKTAYSLGRFLGLCKQAMGASEVAKRLSNESLRRVGRAALLSKVRFASPRASRTSSQLEDAAHAMGRLAGRENLYGTPASEALIGAGSKAFDLSKWMEQSGRQSANLHRIREALRRSMEGGPQFVP
jgi:hypothetical protein